MEKSMNIPEPEQMDRNRLESINIINALRRGTVPAGGLERIAVGLEVEESVIDKQLALCRSGWRRHKIYPGGVWQRQDLPCCPCP